uniref:Uncharacterized protein n=1 Tax=Anguilla anguilla TaxID=7936 RepID=A0A0E9RH91_ANGAN
MNIIVLNNYILAIYHRAHTHSLTIHSHTCTYGQFRLSN